MIKKWKSRTVQTHSIKGSGLPTTRQLLLSIRTSQYSTRKAQRLATTFLSPAWAQQWSKRQADSKQNVQMTQWCTFTDNKKYQLLCERKRQTDSESVCVCVCVCVSLQARQWCWDLCLGAYTCMHTSVKLCDYSTSVCVCVCLKCVCACMCL